MPGQHNLKGHQISIKFPHRIWRQLEKAAEAAHKKPGVYVRELVILDVGDLPLTAEDAQLIADRIKQAEAEGKMK